MLVCGDSLDPARRTLGTGGCGRGVTNGIRADPRGYTGVCGSVARTCGTCVGTGHTDVCQGGTFLWADEDIGSFEWGCMCHPGLIGMIGYSYQQGAPSFPEAHLQRTPKLSVLVLEQFEDG